MVDILLINNYDQPLLQLKGQRMRRPIRKDMLNFNLISTEVCRAGEARLVPRLCAGGLDVRDVTSSSFGNICWALTVCLSEAVLLRLPVTVTNLKLD